MEFSVTKKELEDFKCSANDALVFKLVRKESDIEDEEKAFGPDMTHQVFGESEIIFGYQGLKISLFYTAAKLVPCLKVSYSSVCDAKEHGVPPDGVEKLLHEELPPKYLTNLDTFRTSLSDESTFRPFGEKIDSYTITKDDGIERCFDVYFTTIEEPGFREYHNKMESFIKFYIDAASYIDIDDPQWDYYLLFERYQENGETRHAFAGYMTIYRFYAYPTHIRPRISQALVLPPFQKLGLCARLVQTFYNRCYPKSEVLDITVEDPSDNFQRVRTFVDTKNCLKLKVFQKDQLKEGFTHDMVHEARNKLKLSKLQTRRVFEILCLRSTDQTNAEQMKKFRLMVKKRLNIPFQKNRSMYLKLERDLTPDELSQSLIMKNEQKFQILEKGYQEDLAFYRKVLHRLDRIDAGANSP